MAYFLKFEDGTKLGPIAPDNPNWSFDDPRIEPKLKLFAFKFSKRFLDMKCEVYYERGQK